MKKSIFRPIQEGEDVTDILVRCIIAIAIIGVTWVFLCAGWAIYSTSEHGTGAKNERSAQAGSVVPLGNTGQKAL
jgi:hypothetical protein